MSAPKTMNRIKPLLPVLLGLVACGPASAQHNPNGQIMVGSLADPYLVLIRDPLVHSELRLNDQQRSAVRALTDELDKSIWPLRNQGGEKANQAIKKLNSTAEARMEQILTATQRKRLEQLRISVFGLRALLRDDVAEKVGLSEPQRTQIRQVLEEATSSEKASPKEQNHGDSPQNPAKSKSPSNGPQARVAAILSRQQLDRVREVLGPPVDASKLGYVRFKAPELNATDGWLNSQALTMSQLRGKVVALHFWTFG